MRRGRGRRTRHVRVSSPLRASTTAPTGSEAAPLSGTKPLASGSLTSSSPDAATDRTRSPAIGGRLPGGSVSSASGMPSPSPSATGFGSSGIGVCAGTTGVGSDGGVGTAGSAATCAVLSARSKTITSSTSPLKLVFSTQPEGGELPITNALLVSP